MPFDLNPTVQNRAGELIAQGVSSAGQSIGDAIAQHKKDLDEKKGWLLVGKALAQDPRNGVDPDSVEKMSKGQLQKLAMVSQINQDRQDRQLQLAQTTAAAELPGAIQQNMQPQPDLMGTLAAGRGPAAQPNMTPGMNAVQASLAALKQNPQAFLTPAGQEVFQNTLKQLDTKTPTITTDATGRTMAIDPSGRVQWAPNPPRAPVNQPVPDNWTPPTKKVNGITYYQSRPGGEFKALPPGEQTGRDLQTKTEGGKTFYRSGDLGTWKEEPEKGDFLGMVKSLGLDVTDVSADPNGLPAKPTAKAEDYEKGAMYNGMTFLGGDPNDEKNWQK